MICMPTQRDQHAPPTWPTYPDLLANTLNGLDPQSMRQGLEWGEMGLTLWWGELILVTYLYTVISFNTPTHQISPHHAICISTFINQTSNSSSVHNGEIINICIGQTPQTLYRKLCGCSFAGGYYFTKLWYIISTTWCQWVGLVFQHKQIQRLMSRILCVC